MRTRLRACGMAARRAASRGPESPRPIIRGFMAAIFPFAALRPAPHAAAAVAAVPYDVVNTDEARALADGNPLSFLHVSRAEIDLPAGTDPLRRRGLRARGRELSRPAIARAAGRGRRRRRSTSIGCAWARTCRPALPPASRSTSTIATSSASTRGRGPTRKTIARGTCWRSARRPGRCS